MQSLTIASRRETLDKVVLLVEQRARAVVEVAAWSRAPSGWKGRPGELLERQDFEELFLGAGTSPTQSAGSEVENA